MNFRTSKAETIFFIKFTKSSKSIQVEPNETILEAATKAGLHIPTACGMGLCGTCKLLMTSGEVEMDHDGGITEDDIDNGYILSCCSFPISNLSVEY